MRAFLIATSILALAACGGAATKAPDDSASSDTASPAPAPTGSAAADKPDDAVPAPGVALTPKGLRVGSEVLLFNAGRKEVETALSGVLGKPTGTNTNDECGEGPLAFTDFGGGLSVHFQDDKLVGWGWRSPEDGDAPAKAKITADSAAQLGTPRATVEAAAGFEMVTDSTLGEEFVIGDLGGFFEAGKVDMLYAGSQCFFR